LVKIMEVFASSNRNSFIINFDHVAVKNTLCI